MVALSLAIYIALLFIRPMDWWLPVLHWQLVTVAAICTIVTCFPKIMQDHQRLWQRVPELRVSLFLLVAVTMSWLPAFYLTGMQTTFTEFGKILILYFLIVLLARDVGSYRLLLWTILLCIIWMGIHSILQHHRGFGFGEQAPRYRRSDDVYQSIAFGIFNDPNDLCTVFIIAIPLLFSLFRAEPNLVLRALGLLAIPLVAYGAWLTNSRGGVMGIFGMLMAYAIGRTRRKSWRIALAIIAILSVSVVAPSRFGKGLSGGGRLVPWGDGIAIWKSHPVLGVGYSAFIDYADDGKVAHNSYIHALAEWGMVGYVPFILLLFLTVTHVRRAINLKEFVIPQNQIYLSGMYSALVGYLTTIYFLSRQANHVLYILLGMATAAVLIVCRDAEAYRLVFGTYKKDLKRGIVFAVLSIPFLWITVRIGYALGTG